MASSGVLYRLTTSRVGPGWHFDPGDVLLVKPGDVLPDSLKSVCERLPDDVGVPVNVIRLDPRAFEAQGKPRPEPVEAKPLTEAEARQLCKLQDPDFWVLARQCGFPGPTLKRTVRERRGDEERSRIIDLWQHAHVVHWVEKMQQLAPLVQSLRLG